MHWLGTNVQEPATLKYYKCQSMDQWIGIPYIYQFIEKCSDQWLKINWQFERATLFNRVYAMAFPH